MKRQSEWDIDLILCVLLVFLGPYFIFDIIVRQYVGLVSFQFSWVISMLCLARLTWFALTPNRAKSIRLNKSISIFIPIILIILYTLTLSINQPDFLADIGILYDNVIDNILKRGIKYISYTFLAIYISVVLNTWGRIHKLVLFLSLGLCIAEVLGLIQAIVFFVAKIDILPITRTHIGGLEEISATVSFMGGTWLRINSISHEPKGLATLIFILLIIKIFWKSYRAQVISSKVPAFLDTYMEKTALISLLIIILTFSGSGLVALMFLMGVLSLLTLKDLFNSRLSRESMFTVIVGVLFVAVLIFLFQSVSDFLETLILRRMVSVFETRTFESLYLQSVDPEDGAFFNNLIKYPSSALWGVGFGGFSNLSLDFVASRYRGLTPELASPFSRNLFIEVLFSSGIIGVLGCLYFARKILSYYKISPSVFTIFTLIIAQSFFIRSSELLFFVSVGVLVACHKLSSLSSQNKLTNFYSTRQ